MPFTSSTRATLRTFAFACLTIAAPVAAKTFNADQSNLTKTLNAMGPGDTVILAPGGYGVVAVPRKSWQTPINIDARAASLAGVVLFKVAGVNWTGGTVVGTMYGVSVSDSTRVSVSGVDVSGAARGIVINDSTDVKILKNRLHHLRTDGIDIVGQRVLVEGNIISDMNPILGDHPDGVQMWSSDQQTRDIIVRNNTITGKMQGIFARSTTLGLRNLTVTGNKVLVDYPNGVVLLNTQASKATGNSVKSISGAKVVKANMRVEGGADNVACGNTVPDVPRAPAAQACG